MKADPGDYMITLKKLNGQSVTLNAELIESLEATPDTIISLATGNRFVVRETVEEVIAKVLEYRKQVYSTKAVVNPIEGYKKK